MCPTSEVLNLQQWVVLVFLYGIQLQTIFSIQFFVSDVYLLLY